MHLADTSLAGILLVTAGPGTGRVIELAPGVEASIGRTEDSTIALPYSGVSREHAAVTFVPARGLQVVDRGSTNGTFVEDELLEGTATLTTGQRLLLGEDTVLVFRACRPEELERVQAGARAHVRLMALSKREREVALSVADGITSARVAKRLGVSPRTITTHLDRIYARLDVDSRAELTRLVAEARAVLPGALDPST